MAIEEGGTNPTATATMEDLKKMETSLTSSIEAHVKGLRDMISKLMKAKNTAPSAYTSLETTPSESDEHKEGEGENKNGSPQPPPPKKDENGKGDYRDVSHWYSPDPPIPHPHINHRGDPP